MKLPHDNNEYYTPHNTRYTMHSIAIKLHNIKLLIASFYTHIDYDYHDEHF